MKAIKPPKRPNNTSGKPHRAYNVYPLGDDYERATVKNSNRTRHEWMRGKDVYSTTVRRVTPRPVEIKREEREAKRALKAA